MSKLERILAGQSVIPAIRQPKDLEDAVKSKATLLFILCGDVSNIGKYIRYAKAYNKAVFVHIDLVEGLSADQAAIKYIVHQGGPDGIVSTRGNLVQYARQEGLLAVQRIFLLDTLALVNGLKAVKNSRPDAVELLPAVVIPRVISEMCQEMTTPIIAGGLIKTAQEIEAALKAGAIGVSVSSKSLWL